MEDFSLDKKKPSKLTREMLFLAEQAAEGGFKVLPGKEWSLHYPKVAIEREVTPS